MSFGPLTEAERVAWARTFALEPERIAEAVDGYLEFLAGASQGALEDAEAAAALGQLRESFSADLGDDAKAPERARQLDLVIQRLDRSVGHAELLEAAGLAEEIPNLRPRLEAALRLVKAIRAALARRGRTAG